MPVPQLRPGRGPSRKVALGFIAGFLTVASVVTTAAIATNGGEPRPPAKSAAPGVPSSPHGGAAVQPDSAPVDVGRIRILPVGSVPSSDPALLTPGVADSQSAWDLTRPEDERRVREAGFELTRPPSPAGFRLAGGGFEAFTDASGARRVWRQGYRFESDDDFSIELTIRTMLPESHWEIVGYSPDSQHGVSTVDLEGVTVVVVHALDGSRVQSATQAWFNVGDSLVYVDAPAFPIGEFTEFLKATVRHFKGE